MIVEPQENIEITVEDEDITNLIHFDFAVQNIKMASDGRYILYNMDNKSLVVMSKDNQKLVEIPPDENFPDTVKNTSYYLFGMVFTLDKNDYLYVLWQKEVEEGSQPKVYQKICKYDLAGSKLEEIYLGSHLIEENDYLHQIDFELDGDGNYYLLYLGKKVVAYTPEGKKFLEFNLNNDIYFLETDEENNLWLAGDNGSIKKVDPKKNEVIFEIQAGELGGCKYIEKDKSLYVFDDRGINQFSSDGREAGYILRMSDLKNVDHSMGNMLAVDMNDNKDIIAILLDYKTDTTKLVKLNRKLEEIISSDNNKVTLTITIPSYNAYLETAARQYEKENPNVKIQLNQYDAEINFPKVPEDEALKKAYDEYQKKLSDYAKEISTEIIAGKAADIICLDYLPYYEYIDKNLLLDLTERINNDSDFNINELNQNIIRNIQVNNKLYFIPMSYNIDTYIVNKDWLDSGGIKVKNGICQYEDFEAAVKNLKATNQPVFAGYFINNEYFMKSLIFMNNNQLIDYSKKKAYFNTDKVIALLNLGKEMIDEGMISDPAEHLLTGAADANLAYEQIYDYRYSTTEMVRSVGKEFEIFRVSDDDRDNGYTFTINSSLGISSQSKNQEEAWKFLKYLLSEELQSQEKLIVLPVNEKARQNKMERERKLLEKDNDPENGFLKEVYGIELGNIDSYYKKINEVAGNLGLYHYRDFNIEQIMDEEIRKFLDNQQSAKETAEAIQRKVEIYLNE